MDLNLIKGTICAFLLGLGTLGNISVSVSYMFSFRGGHEKKPVFLILIHLAFTNVIMLLSKGLPRIIASIGLRSFLDDAGCKSVVYIDRVARGLSICVSSLLTVVQAITISPRDTRLGKLKPRSAWHTLLVMFFLWILNASISVNLLGSIRSTGLNMSQISTRYDYCYFLPESQVMKWAFLSLMVLRDALFQGVMGGASGYMVFLLHQHHQRVRHLHDSRLLHRTPPELRAAKGVLLLMLCFLFFYWTECVFSLFLSSSFENNSMMLDIREFLTLGYAIFSPFVLIRRDGHLLECWHALRERSRQRKCLLPRPCCRVSLKELFILLGCV